MPIDIPIWECCWEKPARKLSLGSFWGLFFIAAHICFSIIFCCKLLYLVMHIFCPFYSFSVQGIIKQLSASIRAKSVMKFKLNIMPDNYFSKFIHKAVTFLIGCDSQNYFYSLLFRLVNGSYDAAQ